MESTLATWVFVVCSLTTSCAAISAFESLWAGRRPRRAPQAPGGSAAEPRVDPLLTVVYATRTATGVTQAIAGPFDLGRPQGCPKSAGNGKWRIPPEKEESPL